MFKSKDEIAKSIKDQINVPYPSLNLSNESFDSLGSTIEMAIHDCVDAAIKNTIDVIVKTGLYSQEDFEKDVGIS